MRSVRTPAITRQTRTPVDEELLKDVETLLSRLPDGQRPAAAMLVLASEAAAGAGIELTSYGDDARAYLDSFPIHGRAVVNLLDVAAHWLARRMAIGEGTGARRALAAALGELVAGPAADAPLLVAAVDAVLAAAPASAAEDDALWLGLARSVVGEVAGITDEGGIADEE